MANHEHVQILRKGVREWNAWIKDEYHLRARFFAAPYMTADLTELDLRGQVLDDIDLTRVDLRCANLSRASLVEAKLTDSYLQGADLSGADLRGADLTHCWLGDLGPESVTGLGPEYLASCGPAHLNGANFERADLSAAKLLRVAMKDVNLTNAVLTNAWMEETDFTSATLSGTVFGDCDLRSAKGLDDARYAGPCTVGIDTLYRNEGRLPYRFLQGTGVPDTLIEYIPSLTAANAIQFYSCFISYSHTDEEFCRRLYSRLRDDKLRVWYAPEDMKAGRKIHEQVDSAIRVYDKLLLVLSEKSMSSEWVATEIYLARQRESREGKRVLFPLRLVPFDAIGDWKCFDADTGKDMAREIREYFVPDFSQWKEHDTFEKSFARLIADLKNTDVA